MARAPFQILLFPFRAAASASEPKYAIFRRSDYEECWQGIAGGGDVGESPEEAARREAFEEAGIAAPLRLIKLDSLATVPVIHVSGFVWGPDTLVIPEYAFGAELDYGDLRLSAEHTEYRWVAYDEAFRMLMWDSNKNALWELNYRLTGRQISGDE